MEKNWKKRWMAGAMAFALCCTTLLQTGASAVSAAEVGGVSAQSETQIEVQTETQTETQTEKSEEELIEETVADPELALMVTEGEAFDIQNDFTGLKLSDGDHVELKKAAMEDGTVFDYNHAGTYKCVYLVTPASGEAYLVARNITVTPREAETDGSNGGQEQESGDDEPEADPVLPTISPEDAPETLEEPEETEEPEEEEAEGFSDEEPEDGSHQVDIVQGNEFNIELDHEDGRYQTGETVNFSGDIPQGSLIAVGTSLVEANQTENTEDLLYAEVSYDEGTNSFSFEMPEDDVALSVLYDQAEGGISTMAVSDGDLWDDSTDIEANTYYYYSDGKLHPFDSVMGQGGNDSYKYIRYKAGGKTYTVYAYCMQHSKQSPPSGTTYKNMVELDEGGDDRYLRKAMFYGYGGPGWGGTFNGYNIKSIMEKYGCSSETRAMQHYLVDYLYDGESGFGGSLSTTAKNMLKEIKAALAKMPDPTTMELTPGLSASANGNQSPTFTWKANAAFVITIHLENGVSIVNETTGKTGTGNVSVKGGEKFHLEATTQNIGSLKGKYAITSNYPLNFHAMLLKLANSQDIGFGYYTDTLELNLEVDWPDEATVKIIKKDKGSNALLAGAVYGIYADEACTKLIKKMPATNAKGESEVKITKTQDTVYLREISGPSGYVLDTKAYGVKLVVGQTASKNLTDKEQKGALTIYKEGEVLTGAAVTEDGVTFTYEKRKLKGAVYSVYAGADIKAADGTLIYKKGALVKDNLVTGDDGSVTLKDLYLGTYTVTETKAPDNYVCKGESKTVELVYAGQTVEVQTGSATFLNERQKAAVRVEKQDEETKNPLSGDIYGLYAAEDIKVDGKTVVPKGTLIEKATTGADGKASYKAELPINYSYSIREIQAPELYLRNSEDTYTFTFKFTNDKEEKVNFSHIFTNKRVNATIDLVKEDSETGNSAQGDAVFEGAIYGLYAREDINHPDGRSGVLYKKDEQGNRHVIYAKDTLVKTVITNKNGEAVIKDLPLGKYRVKETKAPSGFALNPDSQEVSFIYKDQNTPEIEEKLEFSNERQKVELSVEKQDAETGKALKGATFGLYNKEAISSGDKVIVKADTLLQEITSNEKGKAAFTLDLPLGRYYVKELQAPAGYVSSDEILEFDATYQGQDVKTIKLKSVKKNQPTTVEVTKADITTGTELDGASMSVLDKDGNVIDSWTSVKDSPHVIKRLQVGKTYILREELAPYGYLRATDVEFTISDTAEVQKVKMEDEVPVARLLVNKKGEFLDSVSLLDNAKGMIEHLFNYVTGNLTDVTFNVYAAEAIRAADGVSADYYASDELVGSITTDGNGIAQMDNLPLGRYYIVEKETSHGYVLDNEPRYVDLTYRDQDTPLVTYSADWQNARQRVQVEVLKKEKDSDKVLSGAIFGLYAADDIVSSKGKVLLAKDTLIELKTTDEEGKIQFVADLPVDSRYYIKELAAPDGYVTDQEPQEFTFEYQGSGTSVAEYAFTFEDEQTTVELSKADLTDKKELPGASLKVTDEDGNTVDEWVSKEEAHIIKGLIVGKKYKMTETKPADGYVTAESIEFTVENTKEVQKHQMLDDVTKVEISKKDITDSSEVPGAKLIILDKDGKKVESWTSTDKPHMVEKLPVGEYTLREEQAPDGYLIAEDVKFTVKDTGKVQKVKMKDAHPYGKLVIKKTDSTSKAALPGAEFELREKESGKVVEKLVTDKTGTATSGKIPIATYKNGKVEKTVEYILVETKAPNGYELSSKKEEIRFEYKDGKTKVIEIVKEIKNTKSPSGSTPTGNSPKTGDSTNIWLPILLAVLSACGIGGVIWYKKKKGN